MPTYAYSAVDTAGARVRGETLAPDESALQGMLTGRGLLLVRARERVPSAYAFGGARSANVARLTRSLATLLAAGLPVARALRAAAAIESGVVRAGADELRGRVERGESVARALAACPHLFSPAYVGHIQAGDASGDLAGAFARVASQMEAEKAFRQRLVSASVYPVILLIMSVSAIVLMLVFVLPRFAELLRDTGASLPATTRALLTASALARAAAPWAAVSTIVLGFAGAVRVRTDAGRTEAARFIRRVPLIGSLRRDVIAARFARVLSSLLQSGLPLLPALAATSDAVADPLARQEVAQIHDQVRDGSTLHTAIARTGAFPPVLGELVQVGEEAGQVSVFLGKVADLLEAQVSQRLERGVTLLEPIIVVLFGGVVGFIAIALLQAVYSVNAGSF